MIPAAASLEVLVYNFLKQCGTAGATDQEIQDALGLVSNTQIPRRWTLMNRGDVVNSGAKRKTRSNRGATVWVLREFAAKHEGGAA